MIDNNDLIESRHQSIDLSVIIAMFYMNPRYYCVQCDQSTECLLQLLNLKCCRDYYDPVRHVITGTMCENLVVNKDSEDQKMRWQGREDMGSQLLTHTRSS